MYIFQSTSGGHRIALSMLNERRLGLHKRLECVCVYMYNVRAATDNVSGIVALRTGRQLPTKLDVLNVLH